MKRLRRNKKRARRGQTIIEFAFISLLFVALLLVTFNAVIAFATHEYLSYAAFMSARALQASNSSPDAQRTAALATLASFIPGLSGDGQAKELKFSAFPKAIARDIAVSVAPPPRYRQGGAPDQSYVLITFKVDFLTLPLGNGGIESLRTIDLSTRSFLCREVTRSECQSYFQKFLGAYDVKGDSSTAGFVRDNWGSMEDQGC